MAERSSYGVVTGVLLENLEQCNYQACRRRHVRYKREQQFKDGEPLILLSKSQILRGVMCRGEKGDEVTVAISVTNKDTSCEGCDEAEAAEEEFNCLIDAIHECLCAAKPIGDLPDGFRWGGWRDQSEELDDAAAADGKKLQTRLNMTFFVCRDHVEAAAEDGVFDPDLIP